MRVFHLVEADLTRRLILERVWNEQRRECTLNTKRLCSRTSRLLYKVSAVPSGCSRRPAQTSTSSAVTSMRSPDAAAAAASSPSQRAYTANRTILNRINSLNVAMQASEQQPTASTSAAREAPLSPATGANALPASPPLTLPSINRFSRSLGPAPSLSPTDGSQDALDILRLSFESPAETAARSNFTPPSLPSLAKATSSATLPQPLMDGPLFAPEHDRNFPVPRYLDHSVFRSRMFTYPSPVRSPLIARHAPRASTHQAANNYSLLGPETRAPAAGSSRKSQLAASLASSAGQTDREDWSIPLPTCWDQEDRCSLVEVSGDGLEVSFCGALAWSGLM